ncbi:hypothetical protein [Pseudonocardia sp. H11422]|uniref:hypothetical protein n=1 Tax=Pseudonocardia sp. H11422 TaxID=2835866 RepID=UPI001BDD33C1|nr:hypothetical protein [Pseudonocardia sp. H11422]
MNGVVEGFVVIGVVIAWLRMLTAPLRNPIALATAAGLFVAISGLQPPHALPAPVQVIANLAVPAMLLAFGISRNGAARPGTGEAAPSLWSVVVLNVGHPALALLVGVVVLLT